MSTPVHTNAASHFPAIISMVVRLRTRMVPYGIMAQVDSVQWYCNSSRTTGTVSKQELLDNKDCAESNSLGEYITGEENRL